MSEAGKVYEAAPEPSWHWRNCRSLGLRFDLWLWPWALGLHRADDVYGGERWLYIGPLSIGLAYSIGNRSSNGLDRFTGMSEAEAYERALTYEANSKHRPTKTTITWRVVLVVFAAYVGIVLAFYYAGPALKGWR